MILKHSFRNVFRSPIKTALFIILLAAVTAFLCLGVNMWLSVNFSLDAANQAFKTIGVVEYRSPRDPRVNFHSSYNYSPIINSGYVELFDHRGLLAGFSERIDAQAAGRSTLRNSVSVIEFIPLGTVNEGNFIQVKVVRVHHSINASLKEGTIIKIEPTIETNNLESGERYLASIIRADYDIYSLHSEKWDLVNIANLLKVEESASDILEIIDENYLYSGTGLLWAHLIL